MKMHLAAVAAALLASTTADAALSRYRIVSDSAPRTPGGPRIAG